ncbi:hypothetical protein ACFYOT_34570 [Saccharothrix saharensis]|uniref:hypothetical protein n=1 Tax=Saccharothrix saharensis TaxID=571190 RepID=UPI003685E03E
MPSPRSTDIDRSRAKLDALGDLDTLRAQAEAFLAAAKPEPADRYDGTDPTRSIWVGVDPRGLVLGIDIAPTWRSRLEPDRFADALHGAYRAAVRTALAAESTAKRSRPTATPRSEPPADPAGHSVEEWLAATRAKLHRVDEQLRNLPAGTAVPDREIRSPNGYLTLRLTAGSVAAITANTSALKWAKPDTLRKDATDAFRAADLTAVR